MVTEDHVVDGVFSREGDTYGDEHTVPPIDQPTARGGITLPTLTAYLGRAATVADLKTMTHAKAREVVLWEMRRLSTRYGFDVVTFEPLRLQLLDFAYNSGAELAIRWLQRVLDVPRTGRMDAETIANVSSADGRLLHHALIAARLQMVDLFTDADMRRKMFEEGLENRALSFSLLQIP